MIEQRSHLGGYRVVDHHIHPSEVVDGRTHHGAHPLVPADVGHAHPHLPAGLLGDLMGALFVDVDQENPAALSGETVDAGLSDTRRPSGDDDDAVTEASLPICHGSSFPHLRFHPPGED